MTLRLGLMIGLTAILAGSSAMACTAPTPTPEAPGIFATVRAMPPPTPEAPGILSTVRAMPPPTPEGPSIMATIRALLATPTPTSTPTPTPGPTPTPRTRETSSVTLGGAMVKSIRVQLSWGERLEGFYETPRADISFSIQGPNGETLHDYGTGAASSFRITATEAGIFSLIFRARGLGGFEPGNTTFSVSYSYQVFGR